MILSGLVLGACVAASGADAPDALDRYTARVQEISRVYNQRLAEVRMSQRGASATMLKAREAKVRQLATRRNQAIADARAIYEKERKEGKENELAPERKVSREQRENELWAARLQGVEEGQKAFWARVARLEPEVARLWAERVRAIEEEQRAFWTAVGSREGWEAKLWAERIEFFEREEKAFWADLFQGPKLAATEGRP